MRNTEPGFLKGEIAWRLSMVLFTVALLFRGDLFCRDLMFRLVSWQVIGLMIKSFLALTAI